MEWFLKLVHEKENQELGLSSSSSGSIRIRFNLRSNETEKCCDVEKNGNRCRLNAYRTF